MARMGIIENSQRYFIITVDQYKAQCMQGIIYHEAKPPGIQYNNFLEMVLQVNQILDEIPCPKQAMELRRFSGINPPVLRTNKCRKFQNGKIATFQIYVKFRNNASWQGYIIWHEEWTEYFESILQLIQLIDEILTGEYREDEFGRASCICQVAVNSYDRGLLEGNVKNVFTNRLEEFRGTIGLMDAMTHVLEGKNGECVCGKLPWRGKIVSEEAWESFQKGGKKATFVVEILYREHSTWQGMIGWRENGDKQAFRSFLEMVILMISALESGSEAEAFENRYVAVQHI